MVQNCKVKKMNCKCRREVVSAAVAVVMLLVVIGCRNKPFRAKQTFFRMDTVTDVTVILENGRDVAPLWRSVDSLLLDWETRFSVTGKKSEVQRVNERGTRSVHVGELLGEMIDSSLHYGELLDGGFDLTILPVKEVWGFGEEASDDMPLPTDKAVDSARALVSYKDVHYDPIERVVTFDRPETHIDIGGIAKGFVLRETARLLDRYGVKSYLIVAGGDVVAKGKKPDGSKWRIGVQHPRKPDGMIGTLALENGSVVTSGDYERFRIVDGVRYHHLFNSATGRSCGANQSLTVAGPNPVTVDILSTGLFCRKANDVTAYIDKMSAYECLVVDSVGNVVTSSGWNGEVLEKRK